MKYRRVGSIAAIIIVGATLILAALYFEPKPAIPQSPTIFSGSLSASNCTVQNQVIPGSYTCSYVSTEVFLLSGLPGAGDVHQIKISYDWNAPCDAYNGSINSNICWIYISERPCAGGCPDFNFTQNISGFATPSLTWGMPPGEVFVQFMYGCEKGTTCDSPGEPMIRNLVIQDLTPS